MDTISEKLLIQKYVVLISTETINHEHEIRQVSVVLPTLIGTDLIDFNNHISKYMISPNQHD